MNIGKRLRNIRNFFGLTQKQFSAGIVTASFYSRVENNESFISIADLLAILNYHHLSVGDFFASSDIKQQEYLLMQAYIDRDIAKLRNLQAIANVTSEKQKIIFKLMFANLTNHTTDLSAEFKEKARKSLLEIGKVDDDALFQLLLLIPIIDQEWIQLVLDYSFKNCDFEQMNDFSLRLSGHVLIAYLERLYRENNKNEAIETLNIFNKLLDCKSLFFEKVVVSCYRAWIEEDDEKLRETIDLLKTNGYGRYVENFKVR